MKVYLNNLSFSFVIPSEALSELGSPSYIQILFNTEDKAVIIRPTGSKSEGAYHIKMEDGNSFLAFPRLHGTDLISSMGWGSSAQELEAEVLEQKDGTKLLFLDLKKARPSAATVHGPFCLLDCFKDEDEETVEESEEDEE